MRTQGIFAAVACLALGVALTALPRQQQLQGQEKQQPRPWEYKVIWSPLGSRDYITDGNKQVTAGSKDPAQDMTKQFNDLAADGWEYANPVAETKTGLVPGVLVLFKKPRR